MSFSAINKIISSSNPVWSLSGLLDIDDIYRIRTLILDLPTTFFSESKQGSKLSIEHNTKLGWTLFHQPLILHLAEQLISPAFLRIIWPHLFESSSHFKKFAIDHKLSRFKPFSLSSYLYPESDFSPPSLQPWYLDTTLLSRRHDKASVISSFIQSFNALPFIPRMQFSVLNHGTYIPPHTDISNKILTLMIYLPDSSQDDTLLGTTFWSYNTQNSRQPFSQSESHFLVGEPLSQFEQSYSRSRTHFNSRDSAFFFRSDNSWHSFEYDGPSLGPRVSLNINYLFPVL